MKKKMSKMSKTEKVIRKVFKEDIIDLEERRYDVSGELYHLVNALESKSKMLPDFKATALGFAGVLEKTCPEVFEKKNIIYLLTFLIGSFKQEKEDKRDLENEYNREFNKNAELKNLLNGANESIKEYQTKYNTVLERNRTISTTLMNTVDNMNILFKQVNK